MVTCPHLAIALGPAQLGRAYAPQRRLRKVDLIGMNTERRASGATVRQNKHIDVKLVYNVKHLASA